jgi:hypothetical protein
MLACPKLACPAVALAQAAPGQQRSGAHAPKGELGGERDSFGTAEALDQGG